MALALLIASPASRAAGCTKTWTGAAGDGNWITPGNWSPSGAPGSSDTVCIPAGTAAVTVAGTNALSTITVAGLQNSGTLTIRGVDQCSGNDALTLITTGASTDAGTIDLDHLGNCPAGAATLDAAGGLTSTGSVQVTHTGAAVPAMLEGSVTNQGAVATATGTDTLTVPAGSSLVDGAGGSIAVNGAVDVFGSYVQGAGAVVTKPLSLMSGSTVTYTGNGPAALQILPPASGGNTSVAISGTIGSAQTLTVADQDQCSGVQSATLTAAGPLVNDGTVALDHLGSCPGGQITLNASAGGLANAGAIDVGGSAPAGPVAITGAVTSSGRLTVEAGETLNASVEQASGSTTVASGAALGTAGGLLALDGGTVSGTGTITGSVDNSGGTVDLGSGPGALTVTGNYTQASGATLSAGVSGAGGGQYGSLHVGGAASLAGTLALVPGGSYPASAAVGDVIPVITDASRTGTFGSIAASPGLAAGKTFAARYDDAGHAVEAVVQPGPPTVSITSPHDGSSYAVGEAVPVVFACAESVGAPGIASCTGSAANGSALDTGTAGAHSFTVTATSSDGLSTTQVAHYTVTAPSPTSTGTVPTTPVTPGHPSGPATAGATLTITAVHRNGVVDVRVTLPAAGRLSIRETAGRRLLATHTITVTHAGTFRATIAPGRKGRRALRRHRRPKLTLSGVFRPATGAAQKLTPVTRTL